MTCYSVEPRNWIFVKGYGFLSFARNMCKSISKTLTSRYSRKLPGHAKQSTTNAIKTA